MKKILVIVDYQVDFVSGSLGFAAAQALEKSIYLKVEEQLAAGGQVYFTMDTHYENYLQTREGLGLPIPHCIKDSSGWNLYGSLQDFSFCSCNQKDQIFFCPKNVLGSYQLPTLIEKNNPQETIEAIEICGIVTNMCVISNAIVLQSYFPETQIIVDASCCGSFDEDLHQKALDIMASLHMQ
ncbi:MAG: isochorismatase family cysteine hydrolase, partial [Clostridiales bacterium]